MPARSPQPGTPNPRSPFAPTRRLFLAGAGAVVLSACSGGPGSTASEPGIASVESTDPVYMTAAFPAGGSQPTILSTGTLQRAVFGLTRGTGYLNGDQVPVELEMMLTSPSGTQIEVELPRRSEQIPRHFYALSWIPDETGTWTIAGEHEGEQLSVDFKVADPSTIGLVQIGEKMRPVDTPTVADARGVDPICTRSPEPCPYHQLTLAEAIDASGPTALMISTPGFCQTGICGPTLEIMIGELAGSGFGEYNVVHAEVYTDPQRLSEAPPSDLIAPTVSAYGMTFEPSLIVADDDGVVAARLDVTMDAAEIRSALEAGLG